MQGWWVEALWRKRANEAYEAGEGGRRNLGQELKLPMPAAAASLASFAHFNAPTLSVRSARLAKHWQQSPEKIFWKMVHYVLIRRCAIQHRVLHRAYIQKANKFAETTFQPRKNGGKSA